MKTIMTKQNKIDYNNVTVLKKVLVMTGLFVSLFGGLFASVVSISKFQNYTHPYIFGFTFGIIGLIIGFYVAKKLKPHIVLNPKMLLNYFNFSIMFSVGFIGIFMLAGQFLNNGTSKLYKCDNFVIVDKKYSKGGFRRPELNILIANIDGKNHRILCQYNYWQRISIGQKVNICIYDSLIEILCQ